MCDNTTFANYFKVKVSLNNIQTVIVCFTITLIQSVTLLSVVTIAVTVCIMNYYIAAVI